MIEGHDHAPCPPKGLSYRPAASLTSCPESTVGNLTRQEQLGLLVTFAVLGHRGAPSDGRRCSRLVAVIGLRLRSGSPGTSAMLRRALPPGNFGDPAHHDLLMLVASWCSPDRCRRIAATPALPSCSQGKKPAAAAYDTTKLAPLHDLRSSRTGCTVRRLHRSCIPEEPTVTATPNSVAGPVEPRAAHVLLIHDRLGMPPHRALRYTDRFRPSTATLVAPARRG